MRATYRALVQLGPLLFDELAAPPDWAPVTALAEAHGLAPALWFATRNRSAPPEVADRLEAAYRRNLGRTMRIGAQLRSAVTTLNGAGVLPVPLKGSLHILDATFPSAACRTMADLDLLVAPADVAAARSALEADGYRARARPDFQHPHELPMFKPGQPVPIELHTSLGTPAVTAVLPTGRYLEGTEAGEGGARFVLPDPTNVVLHNALHAQVQDRNRRVFGVPLRQLHTLTTYARRPDRAVDWAALRRIDLVDEYLAVARRFMAFPHPAGSHRVRLALCTANAALDGRPGDVARNLGNAFAADYLRDRYGTKPLRPLRHALNVMREKRPVQETVDSSAWR